MMKNATISARWFPSCDFSAKHDAIADQVFTDFDQQAEQLVGHDQSYLQLTPGAFSGRFLSGFFGKDVAIHMEYCNQSLEQEVSGSPGNFSIGILLSNRRHFRVNGMEMTSDNVFVLPPGGHLHVFSPVDGAIMAIVIRCELLLGHPGMASNIADWMNGLVRHVEMLHAPRLAQRLREDAVSALESASQARSDASRDLIGQALVASIVAKLTLEWNGPPTTDELAAAKSYERFQECRPQLISDWKRFNSTAAFSKSVRVSRRSVENAFSENAQVGPLGYLRIFRLHQVRRQLANPDCLHLSIGDIAAEHGFWDWSRFSNHYRRHFGELPSATRRDQI